MKLSQIKPYKNNAKIHTAEQIQLIANSIKEFGFLNPIILDKNNVIVAGHGRYEAAKLLNFKDIPDNRIIRAETLTDEQIKAYRLIDNKLAELSDWDMDLLNIELSEIETIDMELLGFEQIDIPDIEPENKPEKDGDEIPEFNYESKIITGDLIELGRHRLLCGDCIIEDNVNKLMNNKKADMLLSDPPYGVSYTGGTKNKLKIQNDNLKEKDLENLIKLCFDLCEKICKEGSYWYATVPSGPLHLLFALDWKNRGILRQIMVWLKDQMVLGHSEYHYKHEPILFGWTKGNRFKNKDRTRTTVFEYARPKRSIEHPTMKPILLWENFIIDGSLINNIIFDPFLGSGTTIIACEKNNRICYGLEIEPYYCSVIIERYCQYVNDFNIKINGKSLDWNKYKTK